MSAMDWVKEKMQQARLDRIQIQNQEAANVPVHQADQDTTSQTSRSPRSYTFGRKIVWLATGVISGATIVVAAWWANLLGVESTSVAQLQNNVSEQPQLSFKPQSGYDQRESRFVQGGDEIATDTGSGLEILPAPAAGKTSILAATETINSDAATASKPQKISRRPTAGVEIQLPRSKSNPGSWAINLASLRQKADAERFLAKAGSKGVVAEINQGTVDGKTYWRVQVTGFSSAEEAKAKAGDVRGRLGLKDVWIMRRQ